MSTEKNRALLGSSITLPKRGAMIFNRSRLGLVTIPIVVLLLFGLVSRVAANPPVREPVPLTPFTLTGYCAFDVLLEPLTNKEKITTFSDQGGNVRFSIITGGLKVRVTNTVTRKSVDLNVSGPTQTIPQPDGSQLIITQGPTLFPFSPGVAPDLPRLALIYGRSVSEFDANFNFSLLSVKGHVEDVCDALASR